MLLATDSIFVSVYSDIDKLEAEVILKSSSSLDDPLLSQISDSGCAGASHKSGDGGASLMGRIYAHIRNDETTSQFEIMSFYQLLFCTFTQPGNYITS